MADSIELDTSESWYKVKDSASRVWDITSGGGVLSFFVGHGPHAEGDSQTHYFGSVVSADPSDAEGDFEIYVPIDCELRIANIVWAGTGSVSNENISLYVRVNQATDYLIATVGNTDTIKTFVNVAMSILLVAGDVFEIKSVNPAWVDGPSTTSCGGTLYAWF